MAAESMGQLTNLAGSGAMALQWRQYDIGYDRRHRMSDNDFIEIYENALEPAACRQLIEQFNASGAAVRGATGGGVDTRMKNSWDIGLTGKPEWANVENGLNWVMMRGLLQYLRKYPYTILGPVWLSMKDPQTGAATMMDPASIRALDDDRLRAMVSKVFRPGGVNLQKYIADEGGYPRWHCEVFPKAADPDSLHRTLLWTVYLNDDFDEGETEFYHQQRKIAPKTGNLLIAPAAFTHTHRGNMPRRSDKYIATSWVLFQPSEVLYAQK